MLWALYSPWIHAFIFPVRSLKRTVAVRPRAQLDRAIERQGRAIDRQHQYADKGRAKDSAQARRQARPDAISQCKQRSADRNDSSTTIQVCRQTELVDDRGEVGDRLQDVAAR